jgi:ABC-type multidrug transport system fused ATPase/permease subunit
MNSMERLLQTLQGTPTEGAKPAASSPHGVASRPLPAAASAAGVAIAPSRRAPVDWLSPLPGSYEAAAAGTAAAAAAWPSAGRIEFKNVTLRYRPGAPKALDQLSFAAAAGER